MAFGHQTEALQTLAGKNFCLPFFTPIQSLLINYIQFTLASTCIFPSQADSRRFSGTLFLSQQCSAAGPTHIQTSLVQVSEWELVACTDSMLGVPQSS